MAIMGMKFHETKLINACLDIKKFNENPLKFLARIFA